jgi:hypothetical protein
MKIFLIGFGRLLEPFEIAQIRDAMRERGDSL